MNEEMKDLREVLFFLTSLANAIGSSLEDDKIDMYDLQHFFTALTSMGAAIAGSEEAIKVLPQLSAEQMNSLVAYAAAELNLPDDNLEETIEEGVELAVKLMAFVRRVSGW